MSSGKDTLFQLKLADFGFAHKFGIGMLQLNYKIGTKCYMAPEIGYIETNNKTVINGVYADIFSLGIVLFIMITGHPPFSIALKDDPHYRLIYKNDFNGFWNLHKENR